MAEKKKDVWGRLERELPEALSVLQDSGAYGSREARIMAAATLVLTHQLEMIRIQLIAIAQRSR